MSKQFYIDVETTGTDPQANALVQIAGIIEIGGETAETIDLLTAPFEDDELTDEALDVIGKTEQELRGYRQPRDVYQELIDVMDGYVDRYDSGDKFHFIGYNSRFDESFIRSWFKKLNDNYFGSWFHWPAIDVSNLAAIHFMQNGGQPSSMRLMSVAESLGIDIDQDKAHDALYDIEITKEMFEVLTDGET